MRDLRQICIFIFMFIAFVGFCVGGLINADGKKKHNHHHNQGARLAMVIDLKHPDIQRSDDAPGWILVQHAQRLGLSVEVKTSYPIKSEPNLSKLEVVIPVGVCLQEYVDKLCTIEFVVSIEVLQEKGDNNG